MKPRSDTGKGDKKWQGKIGMKTSQRERFGCVGVAGGGNRIVTEINLT